MNISSNVVGDSKDENNFPHKLLLANTQMLKFCKAFLNNSSANIKLSKSQLHKLWQSERSLGIPLERVLKTRLPLIGNVLKPLANNVLIPSRLTSAEAATDAAIHKKCFDLVMQHRRIEETNDVMKMIKSLGEFGLINRLSKATKNEAKEKRRENFS